MYKDKVQITYLGIQDGPPVEIQFKESPEGGVDLAGSRTRGTVLD